MVEYGLKDKVALITGMNNPYGIGATTALALAREGAKLVLVYKRIHRPFDENKTDRNGVDRYYAANAGNADAVESKLREAGSDYILIESDISNEKAVKDIYAKAIERFGKVDILVNNAAADDETGADTIEKITPEVIDNTFAVNVRGSILMMREMINHRGEYGRIINISTDAAQIFAGQITGVEGYVESAASGLVAGRSLADQLLGREPLELPGFTALGAMGRYVSTPNSSFQPMNCTFGLIDPLPVIPGAKKIRDKKERYEAISDRALRYIRSIDQ